ncbi:hypothetical protein [Paraburkholderia sp. HD33-4]|uniref:hypothetical protein n=1 Tax=Paraburkholderia sp. HD33-4 TaxID=2883242 RepID=UPI001F453028|nr:hypothetical protein [Paraburkholderia sp. HD33-4]
MNRAAEKRFGLTVGNESGHYIFTLWPQRRFVGHRGMPPIATAWRRAADPRATLRRYHADFRNPRSKPARGRMRDAALRNR